MEHEENRMTWDEQQVGRLLDDFYRAESEHALARLDDPTHTPMFQGPVSAGLLSSQPASEQRSLIAGITIGIVAAALLMLLFVSPSGLLEDANDGQPDQLATKDSESNPKSMDKNRSQPEVIAVDDTMPLLEEDDFALEPIIVEGEDVQTRNFVEHIETEDGRMQVESKLSRKRYMATDKESGDSAEFDFDIIDIEVFPIEDDE